MNDVGADGEAVLCPPPIKKASARDPEGLLALAFLVEWVVSTHFLFQWQIITVVQYPIAVAFQIVKLVIAQAPPESR